MSVGERGVTAGATSLLLVVAPDPELDAEAGERLTRQLRAEIAELDVESVGLAAGGSVPEGAKAAEGRCVGADQYPRPVDRNRSIPCGCLLRKAGKTRALSSRCWSRSWPSSAATSTPTARIANYSERRRCGEAVSSALGLLVVDE
jgi:hypothetical protein